MASTSNQHVTILTVMEISITILFQNLLRAVYFSTREFLQTHFLVPRLSKVGVFTLKFSKEPHDPLPESDPVPQVFDFKTLLGPQWVIEDSRNGFQRPPA